MTRFRSSVVIICFLATTISHVTSKLCPISRDRGAFDIQKIVGYWHENSRLRVVYTFPDQCAPILYSRDNTNYVNRDSLRKYKLPEKIIVIEDKKPPTVQISLQNQEDGDNFAFNLLETDYENFAIFYRCYTPHNLLGIEMFRVMTKAPQPEQNVIKKIEEIVRSYMIGEQEMYVRIESCQKMKLSKHGKNINNYLKKISLKSDSDLQDWKPFLDVPTEGYAIRLYMKTKPMPLLHILEEKIKEAESTELLEKYMKMFSVVLGTEHYREKWEYSGRSKRAANPEPQSGQFEKYPTQPILYPVRPPPPPPSRRIYMVLNGDLYREKREYSGRSKRAANPEPQSGQFEKYPTRPPLYPVRPPPPPRRRPSNGRYARAADPGPVFEVPIESRSIEFGNLDAGNGLHDYFHLSQEDLDLSHKEFVLWNQRFSPKRPLPEEDKEELRPKMASIYDREHGKHTESNDIHGHNFFDNLKSEDLYSPFENDRDTHHGHIHHNDTQSSENQKKHIDEQDSDYY